MLGTSTRRMTRGLERSEAKRMADDARKKREAKLFQIRKVIGPNDLPVDRKLGKVKVEMPENEVKPEVGEEPEVKVRTVTDEIDLDVEEGPAEDVLVLPGHGDQTGSLAGLETNEDEVERVTNSGGETVADLRREIESLRKHLNATISNQIKVGPSSSGVELLEGRIAVLIAENEAQRQKIVTLNELIVEHTLENRRLRKKCNEAPAAESSGASTTDEIRVGRQVGDEMRRRVEDVMPDRTGSGKTGSASDDDLRRENCSAEENLEDHPLETGEPRQQLNEASLEQQNSRNSSEDNGEMNMAQEFTGNPVTISGEAVNETQQRSIKLGIRNERRILRPRPNSQSLRKHHKQLHDDDDKSKSSQHTRQQIAKTGKTKRNNNVPKNRKVGRNPAQVQSPSSVQTRHKFSHPNETPAYTKQRFTSIPRPMKCPRPGCLFRFTRKFDLKRHIYLHDNPLAFQCQICKKVYQSEKLLQFHKNLMHNPNNPKPKPFTCPQCPAKYCGKKQLKRHLKFHENPDAFRCDICKNHYATQFTLRHHKIRYHSDK